MPFTPPPKKKNNSFTQIESGESTFPSNTLSALEASGDGATSCQ